MDRGIQKPVLMVSMVEDVKNTGGSGLVIKKSGDALGAYIPPGQQNNPKTQTYTIMGEGISINCIWGIGGEISVCGFIFIRRDFVEAY